jgi:serine O-acetyltransferase
MRMTEGAAATDDTLNAAAVRDALRTVIDPELGANIVDLGLVREIRAEGGNVTVDLVLTVPGCPLSGWMIERVRAAVAEVAGVQRVEVNLLDEPWSPAQSDWQSWLR